VTELERRYRWLLKAYPRPYREYRTDEILEIVLAGANEQQQRPSLRESWALAAGGLRARNLSIASLPAIALVAAAWSRYRPAFGVAVLAVAAQHWQASRTGFPSAAVWSVESLQSNNGPEFWSALLACLALLPLLRACRTPVRTPWVWPILGALAVLTSTPNPLNGWSDAPTMSLYVFAALAIIAAPIDARMPIIAFALLLTPALVSINYHLSYREYLARDLRWEATSLFILSAFMAATLAAGMVTSRRQARI
jgi:hypothetical protein